jgi:molecular chaperone DnaK (HSP70)
VSENERNEAIAGIDFGTTNSEIAAFVDDKVQVLGPPGSRILPSAIGLTPEGELLVGEAALNQELLHPDRTVRSIKRKMGSQESVQIGDRSFSPQEIAALVMRGLQGRARRQLGRRPRRAVITVPAYFTDAQRSATREAGELAGLEVVRILNEPTAASLAYGYGGDRPHTLLVYDLGGGTFDVSVVTVQSDVTEVLASHGNTELGGDDFDALLLERLLEAFQQRHGVDLRQGHAVALRRLRRAAEEAKKQLSFEPFATAREEALATASGTPLHLELELARDDYEAMIRGHLEPTLESVSIALADADRTPEDLDGVLLVGGATRTPLVSRMLEEHLGQQPRQDLHPDLCVALGAGVLASRLAGEAVERVLVDISPYSFGPSYLGELDGREYLHCYRPIIHRNTPLPVTRTELYYTVQPMQTQVELEIYQGENPDALKNIRVGQFTIEGLTPMRQPNEVLCRMGLDLDGILRVEAIEKATGLSRQITIANALEPRNAEELAASRQRLDELYESRQPVLDVLFERPDAVEDGEEEAVSLPGPHPAPGPGAVAGDAAVEPGGEAGPEPGGRGAEGGGSREPAAGRASDLVERCRSLLDTLHAEDREEAIDLIEQVTQATAAGQHEARAAALAELEELLFFVEGK